MQPPPAQHIYTPISASTDHISDDSLGRYPRTVDFTAHRLSKDSSDYRKICKLAYTECALNAHAQLQAGSKLLLAGILQRSIDPGIASECDFGVPIWGHSACDEGIPFAPRQGMGWGPS